VVTVVRFSVVECISELLVVAAARRVLNDIVAGCLASAVDSTKLVAQSVDALWPEE
jgi:hypothetical protein